MNRLYLQFSTASPVRLERIKFEHTLLLKPCVSVRGREGMPFQENVGSFQWSKAVRSLASFILRGALQSQRYRVATTNDAPVICSGERGSLASSLAYAIEKQPDWIKEAFGVDKQGISILRRLLQRSNASQRGGRPVSLRWRRWVFEELELIITRGNDRVISPKEWGALAESIEHQAAYPKISRSPDFSDSDSQQPFWQRTLIDAMTEEISRSLHWSEIFTSRSLGVRMHGAYRDTAFASQAKSLKSLVHPIEEQVARHGHGIFSDAAKLEVGNLFHSAVPIRVAMGAVPTANTVILYYLKLVKGFALDIDDSYSTTATLVPKLMIDSNQMPEIIAAGLPPVLPLLTRPHTPYKPFMLMPCHAVRLVGEARGVQASSRSEEVMLMGDSSELSSESLYLGRLRENYGPSKFQVRFATPQQGVFDQLCGSKCRLAAFFPMYQVYQIAYPQFGLDITSPRESYFDSVLIANESFLADTGRARAFSIAVRQAWYELHANPIALKLLLEQLLRNVSFCNRFLSTCGIDPAHLEKVAGKGVSHIYH